VSWNLVQKISANNTGHMYPKQYTTVNIFIKVQHYKLWQTNLEPQ